ncbi:Protein of unknown function, partial [Cotesia congregata]
MKIKTFEHSFYCPSRRRNNSICLKLVNLLRSVCHRFKIKQNFLLNQAPSGPTGSFQNTLAVLRRAG